MNSIQATGGSNTTGTFRKLGIARLTALLFAIVVLSHGYAAGEAATNIDDGWRRTKDGWEHISTWPLAAQPVDDQLSTVPAQISPAADYFLILHPALLAVGICVAAGFLVQIPRASS